MKVFCYKSDLIMSNGPIWSMFKTKNPFILNNIMGLVAWNKTPSTILKQSIETHCPFGYFKARVTHLGLMGSEKRDI